MRPHLAKMSNKAAEEGLTEDGVARPKFDRYFGDAGRLRHLIQIAQSMQHF